MNGMPATANGLLIALIILSFAGTAAQAQETQSVSNGTAFGAGPGGVAPGPLEPARRILLSRIHKAQSQGIGIGSYINAFNNIEDSIKQGQSDQQVRSRVESLELALKNQLEKGKILKTQHPVVTAGSQLSGSAMDVPGAVGAGAAVAPGAINSADIAKKLGPGSGDLIEKIKERFGGQLPDIHSLPPGVRDKLINSDKGKELLKKFSQ